MSMELDSGGAAGRRIVASRGLNRPPGTDLAEYPPFVFKESEQGVSVRAIPSHENRTLGAMIMWQLRDLPDGASVKFEIVP